MKFWKLNRYTHFQAGGHSVPGECKKLPACKHLYTQKSTFSPIRMHLRVVRALAAQKDTQNEFQMKYGIVERAEQGDGLRVGCVCVLVFH